MVSRRHAHKLVMWIPNKKLYGIRSYKMRWKRLNSVTEKLHPIRHESSAILLYLGSWFQRIQNMGSLFQGRNFMTWGHDETTHFTVGSWETKHRFGDASFKSTPPSHLPSPPVLHLLTVHSATNIGGLTRHWVQYPRGPVTDPGVS